MHESFHFIWHGYKIQECIAHSILRVSPLFFLTRQLLRSWTMLCVEAHCIPERPGNIFQKYTDLITIIFYLCCNGNVLPLSVEQLSQVHYLVIRQPR